jgi:hypothetical protein
MTAVDGPAAGERQFALQGHEMRALEVNVDVGPDDALVEVLAGNA